MAVKLGISLASIFFSTFGPQYSNFASEWLTNVCTPSAVKSGRILTATALYVSIAKNVTAATGEKEIFARITKPDGDVMIKSESNLFPFEGSQIPYSCRKVVEFAGDEINGVTMYWDVEEFLYPGEYEVEIFADNYLIGRGVFTLENWFFFVSFLDYNTSIIFTAKFVYIAVSDFSWRGGCFFV